MQKLNLKTQKLNLKTQKPRFEIEKNSIFRESAPVRSSETMPKKILSGHPLLLPCRPGLPWDSDGQNKTLIALVSSPYDPVVVRV